MNATVIPDVALVDNTEQRTPLVLVLDCSGSMGGAPITQLNEGLRLLDQATPAMRRLVAWGRRSTQAVGGRDPSEGLGEARRCDGS